MKVGDLVRWTYPHELEMGLVIRIEGKWAQIQWNREPDRGNSHSSMYPIKHRYLEIIK